MGPLFSKGETSHYVDSMEFFGRLQDLSKAEILVKNENAGKSRFSRRIRERLIVTSPSQKQGWLASGHHQ